MTIASAFNDIAVAQGGTAAKSGAITAAIDALNDALAGSDQPQAKTIEQAVRLLGEHIGGGGGGGTEYSILGCYVLTDPQTPPALAADSAYKGVYDAQRQEFRPDTSSGVITKAKAGEQVCCSDPYGQGASNWPIAAVASSADISTATPYVMAFENNPFYSFPMPAADVVIIYYAGQ